jgi:quercetin dioxygenase-like cupin family protein
MSLNLRRVVTGHDPEGRAVVKIDEVSKDVSSGRPGHSAALIWSTEAFPVDNDAAGDGAKRSLATTLPNGSVFRVIEFAPGVAPRKHRTDSIDYAVVMAGEIDMELDDATVHLRAGDLLVQRGTIHNWVNRGSEPCRIAFVLIDAMPATTAGGVLNAEG